MCLIGILAHLFPGLSLTHQVPELIELDFKIPQPFALGVAQWPAGRGMAAELPLLGDKAVDLLHKVVIVHTDSSNSDVTPVSSGSASRADFPAAVLAEVP